MDGTPHLLTDVKFTERRRGYDPEEVDNFLERVSAAVAQLQDKLREATARAEEADARVSEAQRALAEAEAARPAREQPPAPPVSDPEADAERASKILLMAQKTADATIEDANDSAQQTVADARAKAATLVAEAEEQAATLRADAKREADELVERQRAAVVKDVTELEAVRAGVQRDVDALEAHLVEQRSRIRAGVDALVEVLDDPTKLAPAAAPAVSASSAAAVVGDAAHRTDAEREEIDDDRADEEVAGEGETVDITDEATAPEPAPAASDAGVDEEPVVVLDEDVDVTGVDLTAAPQPARAPGGIFGANAFEPSAAESGGARAAGGPDIDLSGDQPSREERVDAPTQQFAPFAEAEDPLGPPDDEADKAMRAFFEADFESEASEQKSRFGFRR